MSRNHYTKQLPLLEAQLQSKLQQVAVLEKEHQRLQHKEYALQNAIHSIQGPLTLVKECVGVSTSDSAAAATEAAPADSDGGRGPEPQCANSCSSQSDSSNPMGTFYTQTTGVLFERRGCVSGPVPGLAAASFRDSSAILQQLSRCEDRVQRVMQQLGSCGDAGYQQLYTTQLLQRATTDPFRMAAYLNTATPERLSLWSETDAKLALLLGKYDAKIGLGSGKARQQVDSLVDELFERIVVCSMLDPPSKHMSCFMINVDTQEFEPYPEGWWRQVVEGLELTAKDKAALKLVWDRVKAKTQQLTQQYERLQGRLQELHMQQVEQNRDFEQSLQELPSLLRAMEVAGRSRQEGKQQQQQPQPSMQQQPCITQQQARLPAQQHAVPAAHVPEALDMQAAAEAVADQLMSELEAEVARNQQLEAQVTVLLQQHLGATPARTSAAAAAGPDSSSVPLWVNGQQQLHTTLLPQPSGCTDSSMGGGADPSAAAAGAYAHGMPLTHAPQPGVSTMQSPLGPPGASKVPAAAAPDQGSFTGVAAAVGMQSFMCEAEEALLQDGTQERQHLEQRMEACTNKIKVLHYCLVLQFTNTLTKKQLATACVLSHPFVFDIHSMCEALDDIGWDA